MVLGHSHEIVLIARKAKRYFKGHFLFPYNIITVPEPYYLKAKDWDVVVYSYNNPTKIKTLLGFIIIDKL